MIFKKNHFQYTQHCILLLKPCRCRGAPGGVLPRLQGQGLRGPNWCTFLFWMEHCGIWEMRIVGFLIMVCCCQVLYYNRYLRFATLQEIPVYLMRATRANCTAAARRARAAAREARRNAGPPNENVSHSAGQPLLGLLSWCPHLCEIITTYFDGLVQDDRIAISLI